MGQLEFPEFPQTECRTVQPVLMTPGRQKAVITIWERDDEPDAVLVSIDAHDGDGHLLASITAIARRTEAWSDALDRARLIASELWYETHSPY